MQVYVDGVGLCGPGLAGWEASRAMLAGSQSFRSAQVVVPPSTLLPANERRRMVATVKLTMAVGSEALFHAGRDAAATATVFTSSGGDGDTVHGILESLATPEREVSPTRFHNSVHNAPAGYWSIATHSREPTTALCGHDISFAAGLLEAAAQATGLPPKVDAWSPGTKPLGASSATSSGGAGDRRFSRHRADRLRLALSRAAEFGAHDPDAVRRRLRFKPGGG